MKRRQWITLLGFAISLLLLYLSLKDIMLHDILETLKRANLRYAFLPLLFIFGAASGASYRWARVSGTDVHFRETFTALIIGLFVNNVLPARIGELARGYVLSRKKGFTFAYAFSTVLVDRFFDLTGLLLLTFFFFPKQQLPPRISQGIYLVIGLAIVCVVGFLVLSRERFANHVSSRLMKVERSFLTKFAKTILSIQENLKRITSPLLILLFAAISFSTWFCMSLALYAVILALNISVPFVCVPFVCALLNMGITIPSSPGYIGLYQFLLVYLLSLFGVPKYEAFAVSLLYHASWYIPYTILGFFLLLREHLKIRDIRRLNEPAAD
ncbi:MAG TPA: lysylphosphatidylglycerol synthase transmembrane domain-containing protein [Syntrophorhabdales bacterium]|nr:lysylphosphatidylglycerol synthase transmembrane domain-containing protein [Syntrophorhabdales bacterium]